MSRAVAASAGAMAYYSPSSYSYSSAQSYSYSGTHSYSYAAPMEPYGFDGFPGNPMLAVAVTATRAALQRNVPISSFGSTDDALGKVPIAAEPRFDDHARLLGYGTQVRTSLALFELLSNVSFDTTDPIAVLNATTKSGQAKLVELAAPGIDFFRAQLALVDAQSPKREARTPEILTQVGSPIAYFASIMNLQSGRHRKTLELLTIALQFSYAVCMRFKHAFGAPRPSDLSSAIQPLIEVPMHPSFPAGHANEATLTARLLAELASTAEASATFGYLRQLANRIGENRVVAGLHFPVDIVAGALMGESLANYFIARGSEDPDPRWKGGCFSPTSQQPAGVVLDAGNLPKPFDAPGCREVTSASSSIPSPMLKQLWAEARAEWKR